MQQKNKTKCKETKNYAFLQNFPSSPPACLSKRFMCRREFTSKSLLKNVILPLKHIYIRKGCYVTHCVPCS
jgi:hypothetical protein